MVGLNLVEEGRMGAQVGEGRIGVDVDSMGVEVDRLEGRTGVEMVVGRLIEGLKIGLRVEVGRLRVVEGD